MAATVGQLLTRARTILQEITQDGTRWTNTELLDWLNEAYAVVVDVRPSANAVTAELACAAGTRQAIPADAERLIDVICNRAGSAAGLAVIRIVRETLDATRRRWHGEPQTETIENFAFDELDPQSFFVYPPAKATAKLEIVYSKVPAPHLATEASPASVEPLRLPDSYAPILLDLVLARAFSKDAETAANLTRAALHSRSAQAALGLKIQADGASSPNGGAPA